jgi:hypothetical protein
MVGAARQITVLAGLIATFIAPAASSAESMSATGRPEREGTPMNVVGSCRGGTPNGAYELRAPDGRLRAVGAFASGHKTGTFVFWTASGARSAVIPYDNDARTGTVALWYTGARRELGRKLEAPYLENELHGVLRSYHSNGALRTECRYEHGLLVSAQAWDARGSTLTEEQARKLAVRDVEADNRSLAQFDAMVRANLPRCE